MIDQTFDLYEASDSNQIHVYFTVLHSWNKFKSS
jgi:hypothetical protein